MQAVWKTTKCLKDKFVLKRSFSSTFSNAKQLRNQNQGKILESHLIGRYIIPLRKASCHVTQFSKLIKYNYFSWSYDSMFQKGKYFSLMLYFRHLWDTPPVESFKRSSTFIPFVSKFHAHALQAVRLLLFHIIDSFVFIRCILAFIFLFCYLFDSVLPCHHLMGRNL